MKDMVPLNLSAITKNDNNPKHNVKNNTCVTDTKN